MTERFKLGYVCGDFGLVDNDEWIDLYSMCENCEKNVQICINKMNALADENEQLKSKYSEQCTQLDFLKDENKHMRNLIIENKQLKQQIKDLRLSVLDSIHEAEEIQCCCNPCVIEECVKKVIE